MDYKGCKIVPHWYTTGYYEWYHEDTLDYDRGHGICTSIEEAMQEVDEYVDSELKEGEDLKPMPVVSVQSEQPHSCKYVKRIGESCTLNNNCKYPNCE